MAAEKNASLKNRWAELNEEQKARARACTTPEELLSLAREEGYELTDDELEAVAGGGLWTCDEAPCEDYLNPCPWVYIPA